MKLSIKIEKRCIRHFVYILSALKDLELKHHQNNLLVATRILVLNHYEQFFLNHLVSYTKIKTKTIAIDMAHFNCIHDSFRIYYDALAEAEKHIFREDFINKYLNIFSQKKFLTNHIILN